MEVNKSLVPQINWTEKELIIPDFSKERFIDNSKEIFIDNDNKEFPRDFIPDYKWKREKTIYMSMTRTTKISQTEREFKSTTKRLMPLKCSYLRMRDIIPEILALREDIFKRFIEIGQIEIKDVYLLRDYRIQHLPLQMIKIGNQIGKRRLVLKRVIPTIKIKESFLSYLIQQPDIEAIYGLRGRLIDYITKTRENCRFSNLVDIVPKGLVEKKFIALEYEEKLEKHREYFIKELTEAFSNISSDTSTFDEYIDSWAKRLLKQTEDIPIKIDKRGNIKK